MALWLARPLKEMTTRNLFGLKEGRRVTLTVLTLTMSRLPRKCVGLDISQRQGPPLSVKGISLQRLSRNMVL
jgi:hypothetical protein